MIVVDILGTLERVGTWLEALSLISLSAYRCISQDSSRKRDWLQINVYS